MRSEMVEGLSVRFPSYTGERVYMREFNPSKGLPSDLRRWQPVVDSMMDGIRADVAYLMVDQSPAFAGRAHRRSGVHIDGYWNPGLSAHGGPAPSPSHGAVPYKPDHVMRAGAAEWLVLASDITGCAAYLGDYDRPEWRGGDCASVDVSTLDRVILDPMRAYRGEAGAFLHESIPVSRNCLRTVVRLNIPQ